MNTETYTRCTGLLIFCEERLESTRRPWVGWAAHMLYKVHCTAHAALYNNMLYKVQCTAHAALYTVLALYTDTLCVVPAHMLHCTLKYPGTVCAQNSGNTLWFAAHAPLYVHTLRLKKQMLHCRLIFYGKDNKIEGATRPGTLANSTPVNLIFSRGQTKIPANKTTEQNNDLGKQCYTCVHYWTERYTMIKLRKWAKSNMDIEHATRIHNKKFSFFGLNKLTTIDQWGT